MGTKTRKALEIEDALGDLGTALAGAAGREATQLSFEVLKRNLDAGARDLSPTWCATRSFPEAEFDREKKRQLDALSQQAKNANAVAAGCGAMLAFGPEHPYGRPVQGLPSTVEKISRDDLAQYHDERWKPGSSALIFVGDVKLDEAVGARAARSFGTWSAARPRRRFRFRRRRRPPPGSSTSSTGRTPRRRSSRSSFRRPPGRRPTTTRCASPTRCGAAAASARA